MRIFPSKKSVSNTFAHPVFGHGFGLAEQVEPTVEGEELVRIFAGGMALLGMGVSAGPGPGDGAASESGFDGVVFEVAEEFLEAFRVKEIGVVAGGPVGGSLA